ncbi:MAG: mechanosensitive ion channel domain-containing protein [Alphaproteobacteria bacterium]
MGRLVAALLLATWYFVTPVAAEAAPPADADIEALIATLEDDAARVELIARLEALLAAQGKTEEEAEAERVGLLGRVSSGLARLGREFAALGHDIGGWQDTTAWIEGEFGNADRRSAWAYAIGKVVLVLALAFAAGRLVQLALAPSARALREHVADGLVLGGLVLVGRAVVGFVPTAAFAAVAYATLTVVEPLPETRIVALALVNATIVVQFAAAVSTVVLAPLSGGPRPVPVGDETAAYLHIWVKRLTRVAAYGGFAAQALLLLGVPPVGSGLVLRVAGLVLVGLLVVFIMQNRVAVADFLRLGREEGAGSTTRALLARLAEVWHLLAIAALAAAFVAWAIEAEGTLDALVRGVAGTAAVVVVARLVLVIGNRLMDRALSVGIDVAGAMPGVELRANRYVPVLRRVVSAAVLLLSATAIAESWGLDALAWLTSDWARGMFGRLVAIGVIVLVALVVIEVTSGLIARFLEARDEKGDTVLRSARLRTLLPLLRNTVTIVVVAVATFTALSELGIDIGPLLAGAGVIGLAVGFGAQTLVKDVITGAFILFENQIAVGDVVNLGGTAGVVETMTIRTVTLRDLEGNVHTIPFGEVKTVSNMTRDFAYAVLDIGVGYGEDTDRVGAVLGEVDATLRQDAEIADGVLEPIEVFGVNSLGDSAVVIRARVKTRAGRQWAISRRYLGAIKKRFDELGIEIPFPQRTIHVKHEGLPQGDGTALATAAAKDIG